MDLASAAVRDGIKAELEIATALAESLPPVRLGKIEFALTDDFAELIANDPFVCMCRPNECARGIDVAAVEYVLFRNLMALAETLEFRDRGENADLAVKRLRGEGD